MNASPHFLLLASHLLEALTPNTRKLLSPDELTAADAALAQLHVVFGPMLISALQLVDRREVVRVDIGGRAMFQVTSSAGAPYTLYLDLPSCPEPSVPPQGGGESGGGEERSGAPGVEGAGAPGDDGDNVMEDSDVPDKGEMATDEKEQEKREEQKEEARLAHAARLRNAQKLAHMYCPCTGYAFNALDGRQLLCKHILAVLVSQRLGRAVETSVGIHAAAGLLGLVSSGA